jgi:hypothetical protein
MKRKTIINLLSRQLLWAFIIISFNLSCKKDDNLINENTLSLKDEKLYQAIINGGVKSEDIKDLNDYYLVEGDILFKKTLQTSVKSMLILKMDVCNRRLLS